MGVQGLVMRIATRWMIASLVLVLSAAFGCGGKDPHGRQALSGTVTFQGQPLDQGIIEFLPSDPGSGFRARAMIRDGKYELPREQGLPAGTYRVLITSAEPDENEAPAGPPGLEMPPLGRERIPAEYNRDSRTTIEVQADGNNKFDFTVP